MSRIVLLIAVAIAFSGCLKKREEGLVTIRMKSNWAGESLVIGDVYTNNDGNPIMVEQFKAYLTDIAIVDENGAEFPISDVFLADFSESNGVSATVPASKYTKLRFSVGVPAEINTNTDPATYPSSSPLSVSGSEGMFWTWNSGYIFVKFEGKTAFTPDASNLTEPYAFHVGSDAFYTTHEYAIDFEIGEEDETLNILFDANKFLNGTDDVINLQQDNLTHTMDNMMLANRFVALFNESISVRK